jgi:hypothetical protein
MEACLRGLLPKLIPGGMTFEVYPSLSKQNLLKNLPARLHGYSKWLPQDWRIIVIVDRDDDDCHELKQKMEETACKAGLRTRVSDPSSWQVVNRLAIEELESWFFGDMDAVRSTYPRVSKTIEYKAPFRDPDAIRGGTREAFERVLQKAGYFREGLPKIRVAREIGQQLDPNRNRSHSFEVFRDVVLEALGA